MSNLDKNDHVGEIFSLIKNGEKSKKLLDLIEDESIDIWNLKNTYEEKEKHQYTILQNLSINNDTRIKSVIDTAMKRKDYTPEKLSTWINLTTAEGYSAMLLAAYKGNIDIIKKLIEHGAKYDITNYTGLNVLHLAAQANQLNPIIYFKERYQMDINCTDSVGSTLLHWASYSGSYDVIYYLMNNKVNIDAEDKEGNTPLHLAVISGKPNVIKVLLLNGANKEIKDKSGNTPQKLAEKKNYTNIVEVFQDQRDLFGIKIWKIPLQKVERDSLNIYIFLILFLSSSIFLLNIVIPKFSNEFSKRFLNFTYIGIISSLLISYIHLISSDPGIYRNKEKQNLFGLVEKGERLNDYCTKCVVLKKAKSKHCLMCDVCIENFDHHCFWVDNCIGQKNINYFIFFIILLGIYLAFNIFFCFFGIYTVGQSKENFANEKLGICILILFISSFAFIPVMSLVFTNIQEKFVNQDQININSNINIDSAKERLLKEDELAKEDKKVFII